MDQVKTGELIKALRQQEGMTQRALAELLGVCDKAVSKRERGCGAPELTLLPRLAEALRTDVDTLLKGGVEPNRAANGNLRQPAVFHRWCGYPLLRAPVKAPDGAESR